MTTRKLAATAFIAFSCGLMGQEGPFPVPPGRLVDLGGYRIHLNCTGRGSPTVLLSPGAGDFSFDWFLVQKKASQYARVCSYDRAGSAWSDPGPQPLTMKQESFEIHEALDRTGEKGPYILVGHSLGGLVMRIFADRYPDDTAGMILVDATSPDTTLMLNGKLVHMREMAGPGPVPDVQTMQSAPPRAPSTDDLKQWSDFQKQFGGAKIEPPFDQLPPDIQKLQLWASSLPPRTASSDTYFAEELAQIYAQLQKAPTPFADKPLITIVAGRADQKPDNLSQKEWDSLTAEKIQQKKAYGSLSRNSKTIVDANAEHHIQLDDPNAVIHAIQQVQASCLNHKPLPQ